MRFPTRPTNGPSGPEGHSPKRRRRILLSTGCLLLLFTPLALSWISIRILQPPASIPPGGRLSWQRDFGDQSISPEPLTEMHLSPAQGTFILPEVLSVGDAVEWEGGWILLDRREGKFHFLHPTQGLTASFGGEGPGPGELQAPIALALQDSLLWILNQRGLVIDRYSLDGGFRERRRVYGGGCLVGFAQGLLANPENGLLLLRVCPASLPGPGTAWIEEISPDGNLSPILSLPLGEPGSRQLHFLRQPAMAFGPDNLFFGTWDAPCIGEFEIHGKLEGYRCLPDYSRPETPAEEKSDLERRFKRISELGLLPISVPDSLPWFDRIFSTSRGLVVRRLRGEEERDLVLLPKGRGRSVINHIFPKNTFVGERGILVAQDLFQGTRIQVFPNPWRQ